MATILDLLNEDCWRLVLDLVPIEDIVRSERVSRGWQNVVLQYLQAATFCIEYPWYRHEEPHNYHILKMEDDNPEKFKILTNKWGSCIKKIDCINEDSLKVIRKNCPNLEDISFYGLEDNALTKGSPKHFKKLKRVHFRGCDSVTDKCVKHWLENYNIEELVVWGSEEMTGKCLMSEHSTKLKSLCFKECEALEFNHLLSSMEHLTHLRKLELIDVPSEVFLNVHSLLNSLPNVEDLCLRWHKKLEIGDDWTEAVGRLRLRRLDVSFNPNVTDDWLQKASTGFCKLNELCLEGCKGIWGPGLVAACSAAGPALRGLQVCSNVRIEDDHIVDVVRACPNLEWIDMSYCHAISEKVVARVGDARKDRQRKLRLAVEVTYVEGFQIHKYPWLILDFGEDSSSFEDS